MVKVGGSMKFSLLTIAEVCEFLRWGVTKFYERRAAGLFPSPVNLSGGKKGNVYFCHEIELYAIRAISIRSENDFRELATEIEKNRENLKNENA
jgi:predicted DNA-binding transcriptional regulator AlpA